MMRDMLRRVATIVAIGLLAMAGCSIANAPDDPIAPAAGGGGGTGGGTGGSLECSDDCSMLDDACNEGQCDQGNCVRVPRDDGLSCTDDMYCTINDACLDGSCIGVARDCPADSACTVGVCDETADMCQIVAGNPGDPCDDGNPCTDEGSCSNGTCLEGVESCSALDSDCSVGFCDPNTGCGSMPINEGAACDLTNSCMQSACAAGSCVALAPINEGLACEDGDFCTFGDRCAAGSCTPGTAAACPENNACGNWTCDEALDTCTLMPINNGQSCDDGNKCTASSQSSCNAGVCGTAAVATYLFEDFSDNSAGWALGPEWQIGPAMMSSGGNPGDDPALDHTPNASNGVAGVVIGGLASTDLHPYYYITSPPMNVPMGQQAILGFYRWLNSDYDPFMHNTVEVWNGNQWVVLWVSGPSPGINDTAWTYIEHDLTPHANPALRVRFGFEVSSDSAYSSGQWNIDDVLISSVPCP